MAGDSYDYIYRAFHQAVNMSANELEQWLTTAESQSVGAKPSSPKVTKTEAGGEESIGHASGRKIVAILTCKQVDLTDLDYAHMRKVVGYVRRHTAQQPYWRNITHTRWRYSLMNWGHDPLKEEFEIGPATSVPKH